MIEPNVLAQAVLDPENQPHQFGPMVWNGNELVFEEEPNVGVAGIAPGFPDELGEELARRWNRHAADAQGHYV